MPFKEGDYVVCIAEGPNILPAKKGWRGIVLKLSSGSLFVLWGGTKTDRNGGLSTLIGESNAYLLKKIES